MQLIQQSAISFDRLDPAVQQQLIQLATQMDKHAFDNAQENLRCTHEQSIHHATNAGVGRKQILITVGGLGVLCIAAGTIVTLMLINTGQPQLAHTVMMSGLAVGSALLGGAGLSKIVASLGKSKD